MSIPSTDGNGRPPKPPDREEAARAVEKLRKTAAKLAESEKSKPGECNLCQVCVRVCRDVIGAAVLELAKPGSDRSTWKIVAAAPERCVGCCACEETCPTGFITSDTSDRRRTIWNLDFEMLRCSHCGRAHITVAQADTWAGRDGVPRAYLETCDACKRQEHAATFVRLSQGG
jgi:NADH dehydrogenase/NADH:ubiquinone oxidoreductase subunit G